MFLELKKQKSEYDIEVHVSRCMAESLIDCESNEVEEVTH